MIRIGLIQFPGSNCERETALAVKRAEMEPIEFLWNEPFDKLRSFDGYIIVGGFSYEDRSRAGIIAALDPVIDEIKIQSQKGKPLLGICNGAQILIESGLVPNLTTHNRHLALTENKRVIDGKIIGTGFYNTWIYMRLTATHQKNAFTRYLSPTDFLHLPIAHAEGRFLMPESLLKELEKQKLNLFQYCDAEGHIINHFPINPNGSIANIAAITNQTGNVMAMMPHPERTPNGDPIFKSMRDYIIEAQQEVILSEPITQPPIKAQQFNPTPGNHVLLIQSMITDNQALTVQQTLRRIGFPVTVTRFEHWEIDCDSQENLELIKKSGLLYAERKECETALTTFCSAHTACYLVRAKDDLKGQQTLQTLKTHYALQNVNQIKHGVVWQFYSESTPLSELMDKILLTHIIGNPYAHEYYHYEHTL